MARNPGGCLWWSGFLQWSIRFDFSHPKELNTVKHMAYSGAMGLFAATTFLFLFMFAATKTQNRNFQQVSENFCLNIFVQI